MKTYGKELIIDLHDCKVEFNRTMLEDFCVELCELIDMERGTLHFWDYAGYPEEYEKAEDHLKGISLVQFIKTSNITIHSLDILKRVYLNIFSCKDFDKNIVIAFCCKFFKGQPVNFKELNRI